MCHESMSAKRVVGWVGLWQIQYSQLLGASLSTETHTKVQGPNEAGVPKTSFELLLTTFLVEAGIIWVCHNPLPSPPIA